MGLPLGIIILLVAIPMIMLVWPLGVHKNISYQEGER